jgi:hypothetical protein
MKTYFRSIIHHPTMHASHRRRKRELLGTTLVSLVWLVEQKICGQFLVLVTGEIGLDDHVSLEAKTAKL